jgi:hypothetical protein
MEHFQYPYHQSHLLVEDRDGVGLIQLEIFLSFSQNEPYRLNLMLQSFSLAVF